MSSHEAHDDTSPTLFVDLDGSCDYLLYQQGACSTGATSSCVWTWALSRNSFFCEASQENYHMARARMLRAEGIRVPWSKEASFFRRFYRIPYVGFSPFGWERGLVYYCLLENCGTTVFLQLCQLSYAWTTSRQIQQRIYVKMISYPVVTVNRLLPWRRLGPGSNPTKDALFPTVFPNLSNIV